MTMPLADPFDQDGPLDRATVDLTFELSPDAGWPPSATETVRAAIVAPGLAEIVSVPLYVDGVSVGDLVEVDEAPAGLRAGRLSRAGRHSTVRVVSTESVGLVELSQLMEQRGLAMTTSSVPAVLAIDVPELHPIEDVLVLLDFRSSMTLTYTVSCLRHRITPLAPYDVRHRGIGPVEAVPSDLEERVLSLDMELRGRVVRPGDEDWDTARQAWNLTVDQQPVMVAEVADAFDVQAVVRFAADQRLRVAPQSTGHNAAPLGDLGDAILLRTRRMDHVNVDLDARSVRVGAGAIWAEVSAALEPHGLAALAGSSPDVGVAGYTLGGGYSWLGRRHGLASSSVTAVELVTADGTFHRVDADNEPGLFWAVRGAAANVGVVCALEMDVLAIPQVYAGALLYPLSRATELLTAYEAWTRDLDEAVTTCIRLLRMPPLPDIPEPLRGKAFVMIDGAVDATAAEAERLLAPLRELGPVMDTFATMPTSLLSTIHLDPTEPVPGVGDGITLDDLTPHTIQVLIEHAGPGVQTSLLTVDIRHLGGAFGRPDPRGGAVDHLPGRFMVFAVGIAPTAELASTIRSEVHGLLESLQPWAATTDYLNFREVSVAPERIYSPEGLGRLRMLRSAHDPSARLVANHMLS